MTSCRQDKALRIFCICITIFVLGCLVNIVAFSEPCPVYMNCRSYIKIGSHQKNAIVAYVEKMYPRIPHLQFVVEVDILHDAT